MAPSHAAQVLTIAGTNFAPFETHGALLCRYGPTELPRDEVWIPPNNTDPLNLLENVVPATFVNGQRVRCRTPVRPPGTSIKVHLSIGGRHNYSISYATLTYVQPSPSTRPGASQ